MKKILFVFTYVFSSIVSAQTNDVPYNFPVKPGTDQWAILKSSYEMDSVCIIPDQVLKGISTKALLITCINYPRLIDVFLLENMDKGINFSINHFNGLTAFFNRPDFCDVLLNSYCNLNITQSKLEGYEPKVSFLQVGFLELLVSNNRTIKQLDKNKKIRLLTESVKKLEQRRALGESINRQITTSLILSRILYSENKQLSEVNSDGYDIFKIFNNNAFLADSSIINKLLIASKNVLKF